jgi:hypothetical protein
MTIPRAKKHKTSLMRKKGNYRIVKDGGKFVVKHKTRRILTVSDFATANKYFDMYLTLAWG